MGIVVSLVARSSSKKHLNVTNGSVSKNIRKILFSTRALLFSIECRKKKSKIHKARREKEVDFFIYLAEKFDL